jgi:lysozyme
MNYQKTIDQLKIHEGFRSNPYECTGGKTTIGYGRNLDDVGISEKEAEELLLNDLARCERRLSDTSFYNQLNDARKAVLLNMVFNLGFAGFMTFKRMIKAIVERDYETASSEMLDSEWARQVGNRAVELSEQMRTGEWQ